ncbi:unnamed protein product [Orchesella dallaii]|uniref:Uncharacterized protein n=1 Tax=Orchesella dallaii TaxID=48710 RepID=A0ABP1SAI9_9HEXA
MGWFKTPPIIMHPFMKDTGNSFLGDDGDDVLNADSNDETSVLSDGQAKRNEPTWEAPPETARKLESYLKR